MADVDLSQRQRLTEVVAQFAQMNPHQRLVTMRVLYVLFELEKQDAVERKLAREKKS